MSKKSVAIVKFSNSLNSSWEPSPKPYNFITDIEDLEQGDTVVVETVNGLQVAEFQSYDDVGFGITGKKMPHKWVIQKIDLEAHNERKEAAKRAEKIKVMLKKEREKAEEKEIYRILAEKNPEIGKLLNELESLEGVL